MYKDFVKIKKLLLHCGHLKGEKFSPDESSRERWPLPRGRARAKKKKFLSKANDVKKMDIKAIAYVPILNPGIHQEAYIKRRDRTWSYGRTLAAGYKVKFYPQNQFNLDSIPTYYQYYLKNNELQTTQPNTKQYSKWVSNEDTAISTPDEFEQAKHLLGVGDGIPHAAIEICFSRIFSNPQQRISVFSALQHYFERAERDRVLHSQRFSETQNVNPVSDQQATQPPSPPGRSPRDLLAEAERAKVLHSQRFSETQNVNPAPDQQATQPPCPPGWSPRDLLLEEEPYPTSSPTALEEQTPCPPSWSPTRWSPIDLLLGEPLGIVTEISDFFESHQDQSVTYRYDQDSEPDYP